MSEDVLYKMCRKCDEKKPTTCFSKHSGTKDCLDNRCKECVKLVKQQNKDKEQKLYPILDFDITSREWQVGKPTGTVFYKEKQKVWQAVIKNGSRQVSKTFRNSDDPKEDGKKWIMEKSNEFGLTRNKIRMIDDDTIEVQLTKEQTMITDLNQLEICQKYMLCSTKAGKEDAKYYCSLSLKPTMVRFHNFITGFDMIDHINRNTLDNRKKNLEKTCHKRNNNNANKSKINTSGYTGVRFITDRPEGAWEARIKQDNKQYGASFSVKKYGYEEAKIMAIEYRKQLNNHFNSTNGENPLEV